MTDDRVAALRGTHADLAAGDPAAAERPYSGVAAHLRAFGPCAEDFDGLLAAIRNVEGDPHA